MMTEQTTNTKAQPQNQKPVAIATVAPAVPTAAMVHAESAVGEPTQPVAATPTKAVAAACCGVQKQQSCCAPSAKASCCGTQPAASGSCGCQ